MQHPDEWAPHRDGNFPTPSGKCEFKSSIAEGGNFVVPLFRQGYGGDQAGEPVDPLPHYIAPNENAKAVPALAERYPLSLISPKSHAFLNSNYGNLPAQVAQAGALRQQGRPLRPEIASYQPQRREVRQLVGLQQGPQAGGRQVVVGHDHLGLGLGDRCSDILSPASFRSSTHS